MSQLKEASHYTFLYQTSRCLHEGNVKETETEIYIYMHKSYQLGQI